MLDETLDFELLNEILRIVLYHCAPHVSGDLDKTNYKNYEDFEFLFFTEQMQITLKHVLDLSKR